MNPTFFAFLLSGVFFTFAVADVSVEEAIASNRHSLPAASLPANDDDNDNIPAEWELLHRQKVDG